MAIFIAQDILFVPICIAMKAAGLHGITTEFLTVVDDGVIVLGFAFQDIGKNFLAVLFWLLVGLLIVMILL
jgi:hypothetical protein